MVYLIEACLRGSARNGKRCDRHVESQKPLREGATGLDIFLLINYNYSRVFVPKKVCGNRKK